MVGLSLQPWRGNQLASFPHTGFYGLSPVIIQGLLRTTLEEDNKPVKATEIAVRLRCCEEYKVGLVKDSITRVLHEQTQVLWTKPEGQDYGEVGDFASAFRIVLPPDAGGTSSVTFVNYRVYWKVQAVVSVFNKPRMLGAPKKASHVIPLMRHEPPSVPRSPPIRWSSDASASPPPRGFTYDVGVAESSFGPTEELMVNLMLTRLDPQLQLKSVSAVLTRHVCLDRNPVSPRTSDDSDSDGATADDAATFVSTAPLLEPERERTGRTASKGLAIVFGRSSSSKASSSPYPTPKGSSPDPEKSPSEGNSYFTLRRSSGSSQKSTRSTSSHTYLTLEAVLGEAQFGTAFQLRAVVPRKSVTHQYFGETMKTDMAEIWFTLLVKIVVRRGKTDETIELERQRVKIRSTSREEVKAAVIKAARTPPLPPMPQMQSTPPPQMRQRPSMPCVIPSRPTQSGHNNTLWIR